MKYWLEKDKDILEKRRSPVGLLWYFVSLQGAYTRFGNLYRRKSAGKKYLRLANYIANKREKVIKRLIEEIDEISKIKDEDELQERLLNLAIREEKSLTSIEKYLRRNFREKAATIARIAAYRDTLLKKIDVLKVPVRWIKFVHVVAVATRDKRFGTRHLEAHFEGSCLNAKEARDKISRTGEEEEEVVGLAHDLVYEFVSEAKYLEIFEAAGVREGTEWGEEIKRPKKVVLKLHLFDYNYPAAAKGVEPLTKFMKFSSDTPKPTVKAQAIFQVSHAWWKRGISYLKKKKERALDTWITTKGRRPFVK